MADRYFLKLLADNIKALVKTTNLDYIFSASILIEDRLGAFDALANCYVCYINIVNKLNECYQKIVHPQTRRDLEILTNMVLGRILEMKHEMVEFELSDYQYLDNVLIENNLTRWDMELEIPKEYRLSREEELETLYLKYDKIIEDEERQRLEDALEKGEIDDDSNDVIVGRLSDLTNNESDTQELKETSRSSYISDSKRFESFSQQETPTDEDSESLEEDSEPLLSDSDLIQTSAFGKKKLTPDDLERIEIVKMIQKHERARRIRLEVAVECERAKLVQDIINLVYEPISKKEKLKAALAIQRHWNRYRNRRKAKYVQDKRRYLLDMYIPSYRDRSYLQELEDIEEDKKSRQIEALEAIEDLALVFQMRMENKKDIIEGDLEMELMYYVRDWYETTNEMEMPSLPEWPEEEFVVPPIGFLGLPKKIPDELKEEVLAEYDVENQLCGHSFKPLIGSELIVAGHWVPPEVWVVVKEALAEQKGQKGGKKKGKGEKKETKAERKKILAQLNKFGYAPKESKFVENLLLFAREQWYIHSDHNSLKFNRMQIGDIWESKAEISENINREARMIADEKIRQNLDILEIAMKKDKGKKGKPKKKKKKKKKGKKGGKKKKGGPDLTQDLQQWQLFEMMVQKMMIKKYNQVFFKDLIGEYAFKNFELRRDFFEDPPASIGDIYEVIKEYAVFPFVNKTLRETTKLIPSILLVGPNYYTYPILNAICTEVGALLFYVNPLEVADKFEAPMLAHLLIKVPRIFEPAVIHIDGAEKPFYKKVPPEEEDRSPKFIAPILKKVYKAISADERVLIVGTTEKPWDARHKAMFKVFSKIIPIPDLDHHTLSKFWRDSIMKYHNADRAFDYTTIATTSTGLKLEDVTATIKEVLPTKRLITLKSIPLTDEELEFMLPAPQKDRSYWAWALKSIPLFVKRKKKLKKEAKERAKLLAELEAENAKKKAAKKKK